MAAAVGTIGTWGVTAFGAPPNGTVTVDSNCSVFILACHAMSNRTNPSAATLGGTSMTYLFSYFGASERITFFGLENPPTGSQTVAITAGNDWWGFAGYNLSGTDTTSGGGYMTSTASGGSTTSPVSVLINYTGTGLILNAVSNVFGTITSPNSGETSMYNTSFGGSGRYLAGAYMYRGTGTSFTTSWTFNPGGGGITADMGVIFVKDGAGRVASTNGAMLLMSML